MHRIMVTEKVQYAVGVGAASGVVTPSPVYGNFLNTHGFFMLSYAEWMKAIGTLYILFMIVSLIVKFCIYLKRNIEPADNREALVMSKRFSRKRFVPFSHTPGDSEKEK